MFNKIFTLIVLILLKVRQRCNATEENSYSKFWYTCDFALDNDVVDQLNEQCSRIRSTKAIHAEMYELYNNEAELFYEFRNKLTAYERGQQDACEYVDSNGELLRNPKLHGYNLENRIELYQSGQLQNCYLTAQGHVEFMKCLIHLRTQMIAQLDKEGNFQSAHLF